MDDPSESDDGTADKMYGTSLGQYEEKSSLMEEIFWAFIFSDFESKIKN